MDTVSQVQNLGTILGVWAHPDDEVFTCGGILSIAAANGQRVMCMTASRGEAGVQDPDKWPPNKLSDIRTSELEAAYTELGVSQHCWFDYPDGELDKVPLNEGIESVKQCVVSFKPDTILTFGPDGMTGHSDHKSVSKWAVRAAKEFGIDVYCAVLTQEIFEANKEADNKFDIFFNIEKPLILEPAKCDLLVELNEEVLAKKCAALKAMPSQTERLIEYVGDEKLKSMQRIESFVLV